MAYEALMSQYPQIEIKETELPKGLAGLYYDNVILLDKHRNRFEKHCVLAEEIGHYETTVGDITDYTKTDNMKLEIIARRWGYRKLVPFDKLIKCYLNHHTTIEDVCLQLEITSEYLQSILEYYKARYGLYVIHNGYKIEFDPLNITKL